MIERVSLYNYRNIRRAELSLHPRLNVFVGANAQGKTNFLEALSFLLKKRSFRAGGSEVFVGRSALVEDPFLGFDGDRARLQAWLQTDLKLEVQWQLGKKSFLLNSKPWSGRKIPTKAIVFTPESLLLLQGPPQGRREFMDELGAEYLGGSQVVADFNKCLKSRNQVLKKIQSLQKNRTLELKGDDFFGLLKALNTQFLDLALQLCQLRQQALILLQKPFLKLCDEFFWPKKLDISMEYLLSSKGALRWSEAELRGALQQKMAELALVEHQLGYSLVGPHKHDLSLRVAGHEARYYCSQGQQRVLVLALKMAQQQVYSQKLRPVFLLDDVFSELDAQRRLWLIEYLRRTQVQAFLSTTDCDLPKKLGQNMFVFQVEQGRIVSHHA